MNLLPVLGIGMAFLLLIVGGFYWLANQPESTAAPLPYLAHVASLAALPAATHPQPGANRRQNVVPEMVTIPAGSFQMGSPFNEPERATNEGPQHQVKIAAFELGKNEVTFDEWDACVEAGGCQHKPDDEGWGRGKRPVINVTWNDARAYLRWLSGMTGKPYRLPTEAEWEYAARAGTTTRFNTGDCISTRQANYDGRFAYNNCEAKTGQNLGKTQPVGSYPANPWGLHDMHGNVGEWVEDCLHDDYTDAPADGSSWTQEDCQARVLRGGSWNDLPRYLRSAYRYRIGPGYRARDGGFRVARTISPWSFSLRE